MTSIKQVFEELNFPSASRLKRVLDARNIPYNTRELERLVRGETTRQVQAPRYKFDRELQLILSGLRLQWNNNFGELHGELVVDRGCLQFTKMKILT